LSVDEARRVIERLQQRYPQIATPVKDDICYATTNRQEAVATLTPQADVMIVLGSQNSSNSLRLQEIGNQFSKRAFLVDGPDDLDPQWFNDCETVLITAGASAPEVVVQQCVDYLVDTYGACVEEVRIRDEHVTFPLPRELRDFQSNAR